MPLKREDIESGSIDKVPDELYSPEEVEAQKNEAIEAVKKEWEEKYNQTSAELEKARKFQAEQAHNFKLLRDMSEEEKSKMTEKEIQYQKQIEELMTKTTSFEEAIKLRDEKEIEGKKQQALRKFAGDDEDLKAKIEEKMGIVNVENIEERVEAAAKILGVVTDRVNPLNYSLNGEAPRMPKEDEQDKFFQSDKGKAAVEIMNQYAGVKKTDDSKK